MFVCFQVAELEVQSGQLGPSDGGTRDELTQSLEELEALLKAKDEVSTSFKRDLKVIGERTVESNCLLKTTTTTTHTTNLTA